MPEIDHMILEPFVVRDNSDALLSADEYETRQILQRNGKERLEDLVGVTNVCYPVPSHLRWNKRNYSKRFQKFVREGLFPKPKYHVVTGI